MKKMYENCHLCEHKCFINRYKERGYCNLPAKIKVVLAKPFYFEEPPISGTKGSGTIFFSGCNLRCSFCQNIKISKYQEGTYITIKRLCEIMLELQEKKVHNINLVTPTMYVPSIIKAIKKAKKIGLHIPIIYNTSSYETLETIKMLDGVIDVYLPDFKYYDDIYAIRYSKAPNYLENIKVILEEMYRQTGPCTFNNDGIIQKGVIIRHLMLPTLKNDTKKILSYLYQTYHDNIYISIMNQYTPNKEVSFKELQKHLPKKDYEEIICYALDLGINNAFCQEDKTDKTSFIPNFNLEGIKKIKD